MIFSYFFKITDSKLGKSDTASKDASIKNNHFTEEFIDEQKKLLFGENRIPGGWRVHCQEWDRTNTMRLTQKDNSKWWQCTHPYAKDRQELVQKYQINLCTTEFFDNVVEMLESYEVNDSAKVCHLIQYLSNFNLPYSIFFERTEQFNEDLCTVIANIKNALQSTYPNLEALLTQEIALKPCGQ